MLRDVVGTFLDTLSERQFDGPLLAVLAAQGFTDVHFIHGGFEFGKDVVAKKTDSGTGQLRQYVIQSKAGDIGQAEWRAVRPQLEECEYNTLGHPSFDAALPRVAVLVTTGRLKGSAPSDAAEYKKSVTARGLADLEIWERADLLDTLCENPQIGVGGEEVPVDLLAIVTSVLDEGVTERRIESYTRRWLPPAGSATRGSVEAAIIINALTRVRRLDLGFSVALQLFRSTSQDDDAPSGLAEASQRLLADLATRMVDQVEPLLNDPLDLARRTMTQMALVTYPVICCRLIETTAIGLALARDIGDALKAARLQRVLLHLVEQPGSARPPSDLFATSVVAATVMLSTVNSESAKAYLGRVAQWMLDRHDDDLGGLGLASLMEDEQTSASRLLGGSLTCTTLEPRKSSYLATAVMELALFLQADSLYEAIRENLRALQVVPESTAADESTAHWRRSGADVWPQPRIVFNQWDVQLMDPPARAAIDDLTAFLLTAACRSRHYRGGWGGVADGGKSA